MYKMDVFHSTIYGPLTSFLVTIFRPSDLHFHKLKPHFFLFRGLADMNGDGQMDANEFSIACKLITNRLKGKFVSSIH